VHLRDRIDRALISAAHFLLRQQSPDGAWRSSVYAFFKEGDALTPLVLHALHATRWLGDVLPSLRNGVGYLAARARLTDGSIDEGPHGLSYPAYTAALTVHVLSQPLFAEHFKARDVWLSYLRERQLTEDLGWQPTDREYGGWGYSHSIPVKNPRPGHPRDLLTESNLSATVFALDALRAAGCFDDDPAFSRALRFVQRCQNYADEPDPAFDDGGFFFMYADPLRNKAGVSGTDRMGCQRYTSYGSMTADGLRALLACGLPLNDARVTAARRWLDRHFLVSDHPGRFAPGRAVLKASIYYYYCWSLARSLAACGAEEMTAERTSILAEELLRRQQSDGSWINGAVEVREDDPLVATSLAVGALAECRFAFEQIP
jgi:squalene-hopene/tetraprenyl-beta-curcumene cyclase